MAMRVPVVVSSVGGPGDEVTDGQDGLVAPPHDPPAWAAAMSRILQDPKAANRMGCAARATAERYSHPEVSLAALADAHLAVLSSS
jgi:glycosyltransferase involved in cell wall biosynthesis